MMIQYGTDYGGFFVDPDRITSGGLALCAGVGEDVSFDYMLLKEHGMRVIAVDPTEKAERYVKRLSLPNFTFVKSALVSSKNTTEYIDIFENKRDDHVSESVLATHTSIVDSRSRKVKCESIDSLVSQFGKFDLIKIDVEGAEYEIIDALDQLDVEQLCLEFHDHCTHYTKQDTQDRIRKIVSLGYEVAYESDREYTFLKKVT